MSKLNNIRALFTAVLTVWVYSVSVGAQSQTDCAIADDYDALALKSESDYLDETALDYRARAVQLCPSYSRWQRYGELAMRFGDATLVTGCLPETEGAEALCQTGNNAAAEAFIAALPLADNEASAASAIGRYAQVLYQVKDPQKSNTYISEALRLNPTSPWIRKLAEEIPQGMNTKEAMRSGLGDFKVPEMVLASLSLPASQSFDTDSGAASPAESSTPTSIRTRAINVPLNFHISSTRLDDASRQRLRDVVEILAEDNERNFHVVGHADITGDPASNQTLSEERADAIYSMLVTMEPGLGKRISHEGVGSTRPLRHESTPEAHRANRRVEIFVK